FARSEPGRSRSHSPGQSPGGAGVGSQGWQPLGEGRARTPSPGRATGTAAPPGLAGALPASRVLLDPLRLPVLDADEEYRPADGVILVDAYGPGQSFVALPPGQLFPDFGRIRRFDPLHGVEQQASIVIRQRRVDVGILAEVLAVSLGELLALGGT